MIGQSGLGIRDSGIERSTTQDIGVVSSYRKVYNACHNPLKHSHKILSSLQMVSYYFGVLDVSFDTNLQITQVKLRC